MMKKIKYQIEFLSSAVVSPRSAQALYKGVDLFSSPAELDRPDFQNKKDVKLIYPFYQYGEYRTYNPLNARYYLPGSSVKGALQQKKKSKVKFMVDDLFIPNNQIVLRNLWKVQYLDLGKKNAVYKEFFENVGIEMIKADTILQGELYAEDSGLFSELVKEANKDVQEKMLQMYEHVTELVNGGCSKELEAVLSDVERNMTGLLDQEDVILIGGYKGLLHSILLKNKEQDVSGGLFFDFESMLPHGLARMKQVHDE